MIPVPNEPGNDRTDWTFRDVPGLRPFQLTSAPDGYTVLLLLHGDAQDPPQTDSYLWPRDDSGYRRHVRGYTTGSGLATVSGAFSGKAIRTNNDPTAGLVIVQNGSDVLPYVPSDLNFRDQAFTLEVRLANDLAPTYASGPQTIFNFGSWFVGLDGPETGMGAVRITTGSVGNLYSETFTTILASSLVYTKPMSTFAHLAITRNAAGVVTIWWNGVNVGSATWNPPASTAVELFNYEPFHDDTYPLRFWWADDVRWSLGCRYTASFTPQSAEWPNP